MPTPTPQAKTQAKWILCAHPQLRGMHRGDITHRGLQHQHSITWQSDCLRRCDNAASVGWHPTTATFLARRPMCWDSNTHFVKQGRTVLPLPPATCPRPFVMEDRQCCHACLLSAHGCPDHVLPHVSTAHGQVAHDPLIWPILFGSLPRPLCYPSELPHCVLVSTPRTCIGPN